MQFIGCKSANVCKKVSLHYSDMIDSISHNDEREFYIFHLIGSHAPYVNHYPGEFSKFSVSDIKENIGKKEKRILSEYANTNFYTDFEISEIWENFKKYDSVLIYSRDHGENIFDYQNLMGHFRVMHKCVYDIPFFIIVSEKYKNLRHCIFNRILGSKDKPFMNDNLPHTLINLGEIITPEYDEKKDIINSKFEENRSRIVNKIFYKDGVNYDIDLKNKI